MPFKMILCLSKHLNNELEKIYVIQLLLVPFTGHLTPVCICTFLFQHLYELTPVCFSDQAESRRQRVREARKRREERIKQKKRRCLSHSRRRNPPRQVPKDFCEHIDTIVISTINLCDKKAGLFMSCSHLCCMLIE